MRRGVAAQGRRDRTHIIVRGARMLATLAPFADELIIYPGSDIRPQDGRYALSFADADGHARAEVHLPRPLLDASAITSTTRCRRASTRWTRW